MIFTKNAKTDFLAIMTLIDAFSEANHAKVSVNEDALFALTHRIHIDFPCKNGLENANVFKKASAFLCEFVGEQMINSLDCEKLSDDITKIKKYESALIGFYIVTSFLSGATVNKNKIIFNSIELSSHSYADIVDSMTSITLLTSFKLVAVLLEQLVYKTNPGLQYNTHTIN